MYSISPYHILLILTHIFLCHFNISEIEIDLIISTASYYHSGQEAAVMRLSLHKPDYDVDIFTTSLEVSTAGNCHVNCLQKVSPIIWHCSKVIMDAEYMEMYQQGTHLY